MPMSRVRTVCRLGEGERCCIFLIASALGFYCAKGTSLEESLRLRRPTMTAHGDNCSGPPDFREAVSA